MRAKDCPEEFKVKCALRRLSPRTTKGYCCGVINAIGAESEQNIYGTVYKAALSKIRQDNENGMIDANRYLTWLLKTANNADLTDHPAVQNLLSWNAPAPPYRPK